MFIHTIDPVLVSIGPVHIRYYGVVYALGFLMAFFVLRYFAKQGNIKNLTAERAESLVLWLMVGIVAGARIGYVLFWHPSLLWTDPLSIFYIWQGGLAFHGGILGAALVLYAYCRRHKISFWQLADVLAIIASFGLFLGRIANFINAEVYGRITDVPWGVNFNDERTAAGELVYRHPSQLYESAKNLLNFIVLLVLYQKNQAHKRFPDGFIAWLFVALYGLLRLITNFWREDPLYWGLSTGQWLSLAMFIVGSIMLYRMRKHIRTGGSKHHR